MMSTNNVLSPANGAPIIVPSQDMILGLYYVTLEREGMKGEGMVFADVDEVRHALDAGEVHLHSRVKARIKQIDEEGNEVWQRFDTTPGRVLLGDLLPLNAKAPFDLVNRLLRKKEVQQVIDTVYRYCGQKESVIFCDQIMTMGFREAFKAGNFLRQGRHGHPEQKWSLVDETRDQVKEFEQQYMDGLITQGEKYNKVIDAWSKSQRQGHRRHDGDHLVQEEGTRTAPRWSRTRFYMMAHSGARGSVTQMKQLGGMRGLMAKPSGEIIETPIISNFKEGLTVLEYFNSTHGARKGSVGHRAQDRELGLPDPSSGGRGAGLHRADERLRDGETRSPPRRPSTTVRSWRPWPSVFSDGPRARDILVPGTDEVIVAKGELIDERRADAVETAGVQVVAIRSPLTCEAEEGVCATCYGRDLARGTKVNTGEAVGIIAAQSIGEPGTQLTMRTFPHRRRRAGRSAILPGGECRGQGQLRQPQPAEERRRRADRHGPEHDTGHHRRSG